MICNFHWFSVSCLCACLMSFGFFPLSVFARGEVSGGVITGKVENIWIARGFPIVVYIEDIQGMDFPPPQTNPSIDQKAKEFIPHILPVQVGSTVDFFNSDQMAHTVLSPDNEGYDLGQWPYGEKRSYTFKQTGVYAQLCKLHPEMLAFIIVVKTPFFAMTYEEGKFTIRDVPPGSYKLRVWGERLKEKQLNKSFDVKVSQGEETYIEIKP